MILFKMTFIILWPVQNLIEDDFYGKTTVLYRFLYAIPMTINFRTGFYTITYASEYFLHVNGFGAYPVETESRVARGPTKLITQEMIKSAHELEYSNLTIKTNDIKKMEGAARFDESVKSWNITVQWWFSNYVYKRLPYKEYPWFSRIITFGISTLWHGNDLGYILILFPSIILVIITEKLFEENIFQHITSKIAQKLIFIFQFSLKWFYSYIFVCVYLQSFDRVWRYYSSTNFIGLKITLGYTLILLMIHLKRKQFISKLGKRINSMLF